MDGVEVKQKKNGKEKKKKKKVEEIQPNSYSASPHFADAKNIYSSSSYSRSKLQHLPGRKPID
jgi:hypothetical protein